MFTCSLTVSAPMESKLEVLKKIALAPLSRTHKKVFLKNYYVFRGAQLANKKFKSALAALYLKWHDKEAGERYLKFPYENEWTVLRWNNFSMSHVVARFFGEQHAEFLGVLTKKKEEEFYEDVCWFLNNFNLSIGWFDTVAQYVTCLWVCPPFYDVGVKKKVSKKSIEGLLGLEGLVFYRYYSTDRERFKNFKRFSDSTYLHLWVKEEGRKKLSKKEFYRSLKGVFKKRKEQRERGFPTKHIPELKFMLTDKDAVRRMFPGYNSSQVRRKVNQMKTLRKRLSKLP